MDKFTINQLDQNKHFLEMDKVPSAGRLEESFLFSSEFGEDSYLLASSSSSDYSDEECCCSHETGKAKRPKKVYGFAEATAPMLNPDDFKSNFRVNRTTFVKISEMIQSDFTSEHKGGWERITPEKAAFVLLWYLGNQETFKQTSERFKITMSCIHNIVKTGSQNLSCRIPEHVLWPSAREYPTISQLFEEFCEFKDVIGAIGVSYLKIPKPKERSSSFICKNSYYSIAVQGVVTINKKFIDFYISEGSNSPEDILNKSSIPFEANNGLFENYYLIGHQVHPRHPWLLQPIEDDGNLNPSQTHFNKCYDAGFNIVHEAFGLLKGRFQHLQHLDNRDVSFIKQCVEAACVIHNLCIDCEDYGENFFVQDSGLLEESSVTNEMTSNVAEEVVDSDLHLDSGPSVI